MMNWRHGSYKTNGPAWWQTAGIVAVKPMIRCTIPIAQRNAKTKCEPSFAIPNSSNQLMDFMLDLADAQD